MLVSASFNIISLIYNVSTKISVSYSRTNTHGTQPSQTTIRHVSQDDIFLLLMISSNLVFLLFLVQPSLLYNSYK